MPATAPTDTPLAPDGGARDDHAAPRAWRRAWALAAAASLVGAFGGCRSRGEHPAGDPAASAGPSPGGRPLAVPPSGCTAAATAIAPGLTGARVASGVTPDDCVTLVRVDPARWRLRLLTAREHGGSRSAPAWARDFGLTGVVNAGMFFADGRSIGLLQSGRAVNNPRDNAKLGAFLAFDPVKPARDPAVVLVGRPCAGFDLAELRRRYRSIVQSYRLLECDGGPLAWEDDRRHSAAAVAVDRDGQLVLVHARGALRMAELSRALARPELGLVSAMFVEGGPEASLFVHAGSTTLTEVGTFHGAPTPFLDIPNVLGFQPRDVTPRSKEDGP